MADDSTKPVANRFDVEEGQEVVRHTIVGGRPRARRKRKIAIPIGLEKVLTRAAGDPAFRRRLFESRQAALAAVGWELAPSEAVILGAVPDPVLATMIDRIDLKQHAKRRFMKGIATAVFATAAMTAGVGCKGTGDTDTLESYHDLGSGPDVADVVELNEGYDITKGDVADLPDIREIFPDAGTQPDVVDANDISYEVGTSPDEVEIESISPPDAGVAPEEVEAEEVMPAGILPDAINEVEVDQGQNDGGVRPDTDVTE